MDLGIAGRTALITGADSGIGHATAHRLLEAGAKVVLTDIDGGKLDASTANLRSDGPAVHAFAADLSDERAVTARAREVQAAVGDIDILVNSAGITGAQGLFHEIDDAGWMRTINTDLLAPVRVTRAFLPALRRGGMRSDRLHRVRRRGPAVQERTALCAAKARILALSKGLSHTYADEGLLVNAVSPAFIATPMTDAMMNRRAQQAGTNRRRHPQLPGRGAPRSRPQAPRPAEEVADVIAFLCSDLASFVNGSNYRADSGSVFTI